MEKSITFDKTAFGADVLRKAVAILDERTSNNGIIYSLLKTSLGEATWTYDEVEEFWAEYPKATGPVVFWAKGKGTSELGLVLYVHGTGNRRWTSVSVTGSTRADVESVFNIFEASREASRFPDEPVQAKGKIFIGHGGSVLWQDLHNHLVNLQGYEVEAYEVGARAGHGVRDLLETMLNSSHMAFLIMTGEDETAPKKKGPTKCSARIGSFPRSVRIPAGHCCSRRGN